MAVFLQPIKVDTSYKCLTESGERRTEADLNGDVRESGTDEWTFLEAVGDPEDDCSSDATYSGLLYFGVQCVGTIEFEISWQIETLNDGHDWLRITLNPGATDEEELFYNESVGTSSDPCDVTTGSDTVTKDLPERACGHVILIESSTDDTQANNGIFYTVGVSLDP